MSEIAKCPLCGLEMSRYVYRQREVISCDSEDCSFRCNNADLPRIAAAMELAQSTVEFTVKVNPVLMRHRHAHDRVMEVFNG